MTITTTGLTETTRKKLKETVDAIRKRLLEDLYAAADRRYSFALKDRSRLNLHPVVQYDYQQLQNWCQQSHGDFQAGLQALLKETAYTLTNRLFILRQLEARGLQKLPILTGAKESPGYKEFREFCPELCQGDDEGFLFLLRQLFDKMAHQLPGFFAHQDLQDLIPVPGPTLFWLLEMLNQKELIGAWNDDTTLGWLYQYWNDPDRTAVNDKIGGKGVAKGKVEAHEIAHATQLFTERYMVEWLLQNSLGTQWLAICAKKGWQPEAHQVIKTLEERRQLWREQIATKAVPEDQAMPIENEAEERWKYYVDQPIPAEVIAAAPDSLKALKVLDPACGSGHFLVYAFDLLYAFYAEEATLSGQPLNPETIINHILAHNLHGIDIDPRAVQLAAAALLLKAQSHVPGFKPSKLNLVATDLGLSDLQADDPSITRFREALTEAGMDPQPVDSLIASLQGADYLGSLLQVDTKVFQQSTLPLWQNHEEHSFAKALKHFLMTHDQGNDLGVVTRAQQLSKGLRLIELLGQKYQVVCANPPYLSKSKCHKEIEGIFKRGSELYEEFFYRFIDLAADKGFIAALTAQNFMFISKFETLRKSILEESLVYRCLHFGSDTFQDVLNALGFTALVQIKTHNLNSESTYIRLERIPMRLKQTNTLCPPSSRLFTFQQSKFKDIAGSPMIYWWPEEFRQVYLQSPKVGEVGEVKIGLQTGNNDRFLRKWWEINFKKIDKINNFEVKLPNSESKWFPYTKGGDGTRWYESIQFVLNYKTEGKEIRYFPSGRYGRGATHYYKPGIAFPTVGNRSFPTRMTKYKSIFDVVASSIFSKDEGLVKKLLPFTNSAIGYYTLSSLNPTIHYTSNDIQNTAVLNISDEHLEIQKLYDKYFSSNEDILEFNYSKLFSEAFEAAEILIRSDIDREIYAQFQPATIAAIKAEVGESPGNYHRLSEAEIESIVKGEYKPPLSKEHFSDIYLNGPLKYEYGEIKCKADGSPERGKLQGLEDLCHEFQLHPESIIALRKALGLQRKSDRQDAAYRHLAWALGIVLGRFDAQTGGLVDLAEERRGEEAIDPQAPTALPHGMFFVSERGQLEADDPSIGSDQRQNGGVIQYLQQILAYKHGPEQSESIWQEIQAALVYDCKSELSSKDRQKLSMNQFLRESVFDFHKSVYDNRPIYFPLSSKKKNYVVWVNIHQWHDSTLPTLLAEFLMPEKRTLELRLTEMRQKKVSTTDKAALNQLEKAIGQYSQWQDELEEMIVWVDQIANKGANPDKQEREMPFVMDLDDGVMINSAALWPLLDPQWKDPKKWWVHLEKPVGKNDYDWSHLAMRYWPQRVWKKLEKDPSLAVAHSDYGEYSGRDLFAELHPEMAKKWEEEQAKR